jgi:hypothetical protein
VEGLPGHLEEQSDELLALSPLYLEVRVYGLPSHLEEQSYELLALTPVLDGERVSTGYLAISKSSLTSFSLSPLY